MLNKLIKSCLKSPLFYGLVVLLILEVILTALIPTWRAYFYGLLAAKQATLATKGLLLYLGLIGGIVGIQSLKILARTILAISNRKHVTDQLLKRWNQFSDETQKTVTFIAQRINLDTHQATVLGLTVVNECAISLFILIWLVITTEQTTLMLASVGYILVSLALMKLFNKPMIDADINLQTAEADQRHELTKMSMGIEARLGATWKDVAFRLKRMALLTLGYNSFLGLQGGISTIIAFIIVLPGYFAGTTDFGSVMGAVSAFDLMVVNGTILLNLYPQLITCIASWKRIQLVYNTKELK